jgi:hypothetical protein
VPDNNKEQKVWYDTADEPSPQWVCASEDCNWGHAIPINL